MTSRLLKRAAFFAYQRLEREQLTLVGVALFWRDARDAARRIDDERFAKVHATFADGILRKHVRDVELAERRWQRFVLAADIRAAAEAFPMQKETANVR